MSVFAIQCYTGEELKVIKKLEYLLQKRPYPLVKAVHAFKTYQQKFRGEDTARKEFKSAVPGYIFIELNNGYHTLPADIWHLVKSIPKVCRIFRDKIPEEEIKQFFESVDVEPDIEVKLSHPAKTEEELVAEEQETLHEANMAGTNPVTNETTVEHVNDLKEQAKGNNAIQQMIRRCKAFIQRKKETFVFPASLFHKTRKRIDPQKQMTVRELTDGDYIIPQLIKTLEAEVSLQ